MSSCLNDLFDPYSNDPMVVTLTLARPVRVDLFAVSAGPSDNVYQTIVSEKAYAAGTYQYTWDGWLPNGAFLSSGGSVRCSAARLMNDNVIIVTGDAPQITQLEIDPRAMHLSYGQPARIRYTVSKEHRVTVTVTSPSGVETTVFADQQGDPMRQANVQQEVEWKGLDSSDPTSKTLLMREEGYHTVKIRAVDANNKQAIRRGLVYVSY